MQETNKKTNSQRGFKNSNILKLTESAIMLGLSLILTRIPIFEFFFGGSVTLFGQLPVILISYRHGLKWGLGTGFAMGLMQALMGLNNLSYVARTFFSIAVFFLADYLLAFGALGLGGMFKKSIKNQAVALTAGTVVASVIRYACHVVSGIAIWSSYAEETGLVRGAMKILNPIFGNFAFWTNSSDKILVVVYSLTYNGAYMLFETIITIVGAVALSLAFNLKNERITSAIRKPGKKAEITD